MYLKSIDVNGFKSFANRITFKFDKGITGIVGPNGSGKSNVGDAVRWVLGEQSAKQLRGSKMEDVIFSGTELRKPQGSAYVAITLDNSDKRLPIDYNEVTVARRVYRSGESEYLINGVVSRLRDVHQLFFDTGIGKEGYSIIGQGQIEKILSGKPEEKRELFDEAAGIVKYKKNKLATEKALNEEHLNLSRVNDILKELEKQVGPLEEQSKTAKKYLIFKDELRKFEINSFLLANDKTKKELESLEEKLDIIKTDINKYQEEFDFTKLEYERLELEIEELNNLIEELKSFISDNKLKNERFEGEIKVVTEQIASAKKSEQENYAQIDRITIEEERLEEEYNLQSEKKKEVEASLLVEDENLKKAREEKSKCEADILDVEIKIENLKADIIEFLNEGGTLKAKVGRYDTMLENIDLRKTELNQKFLTLKSNEAKDKEDYKIANQNLSSIEESIRTNEAALSKAESQLRANIDRNNTVKNEIQSFNQKMISLQSKKEALRNLTERYEGYGVSIKKVMEKKDSNPKIHGVVADIIQVEKEYETAIETALGGSIQNIVTEDENTAKELINYLKANKLGRATFLPIASVTGQSNVSPDALSEEGVIGIASKLVNTDKKYQGIITSLLGRSIVVKDIDCAIKIARKYRQSLRLVTLSGELINPGGAMTGGAFRNSSNLLGRKRELEQLTEEIKEANTKYLTAKKEETELKMKRDSLKEQKDKLSQTLQKLYLEKNTLTINIRQLEEKLKQATSGYASIQRENSELESQIKDIEKSKEELFDSNKQHELAIKQHEGNIAALEKELSDKKDNLRTKDNIISSLLVSVNAVNQKLEFISENISRIRAEKHKFRDEKNAYLFRVSNAGTENEKLNEKINSLKNHIEENKRIISIKEDKLTKETLKRDNLNKSHKEFFSKREELSAELAKLDKEQFRLNSQSEKLVNENESLSTYMWEEYELTYQAATELRSPELNDAAALKKEINSVKAKIKELGNVNVNSIEEYKAVSERYEFLKTQHDDIVKAENNLINIINELDKAMKETFAEKFKAIREMFQKVFKELFGGGKADLLLVDETDLLETGIIINAQPPGKKLQNMMQLSGGEKSLTAISLLFAIQSLKPSPFCLLDEIEAALDDSNVRRFAKYLEKLTKDTQFIVITHRKGTMEQADVLYGITMQEKGVSTLVSVNMIDDKLLN